MAKVGTEPFTQIPNRLIRSEVLDVYEKLVFIVIVSCNPSYPTYETIQKWTGMSRERIWKSLQKLEVCGLLRRYKRGRAVEYVPWFISSPGETMEARSVRYTNYYSSPDELKSVRRANAKKNKEKEQIKIGAPAILEISESLTLAELTAEANRRRAAV